MTTLIKSNKMTNIADRIADIENLIDNYFDYDSDDDNVDMYFHEALMSCEYALRLIVDKDESSANYIDNIAKQFDEIELNIKELNVNNLKFDFTQTQLAVISVCLQQINLCKNELKFK